MHLVQRFFSKAQIPLEKKNILILVFEPAICYADYEGHSTSLIYTVSQKSSIVLFCNIFGRFYPNFYPMIIIF